MLISEFLIGIGVALCPLGTLVLLIWFIVSVVIPINQRLAQLRRRRTTPCDRCLYFNVDQELHCAVQPYLVLTKQARECRDFDPTQNLRSKIRNPKSKISPCNPGASSL
ncbi:MAG: hypothetical protein F6K09_12285 [Merismopedia sp. SIO2A8]|nr:hypothetical protein [Symploca sp. SIO2B6]NET49473.1 hypothetical protein [Merismopedia sp. SIO2A8]